MNSPTTPLQKQTKWLFWTLFITLFLAVTWYYIVRRVISWDLWWHMAAGRFLLENGLTYPPADTFTFSPVKDAGFLSKTWLGDIIFYLSHYTAGFYGLQVLRGVMIISPVLFFLHLCRFRANAWTLFGSCMIVIGTIQKHLTKNALFSLFFISFFAWLWVEIRVKGKLRLIWLYPPSILLWSRLHGEVKIGIALILVIFIGELLDLSVKLIKFAINHLTESKTSDYFSRLNKRFMKINWEKQEVFLWVSLATLSFLVVFSVYEMDQVSSLSTNILHLGWLGLCIYVGEFIFRVFKNEAKYLFILFAMVSTFAVSHAMYTDFWGGSIYRELASNISSAASQVFDSPEDSNPSVPKEKNSATSKEKTPEQSRAEAKAKLKDQLRFVFRGSSDADIVAEYQWPFEITYVLSVKLLFILVILYLVYFIYMLFFQLAYFRFSFELPSIVLLVLALGYLRTVSVSFLLVIPFMGASLAHGLKGFLTSPASTGPEGSKSEKSSKAHIPIYGDLSLSEQTYVKATLMVFTLLTLGLFFFFNDTDRVLVQSMHEGMYGNPKVPDYIQSLGISPENKNLISSFRLHLVPYFFLGALPLGLALLFMRTKEEPLTGLISLKRFSILLSVLLLAPSLYLSRSMDDFIDFSFIGIRIFILFLLFFKALSELSVRRSRFPGALIALGLFAIVIISYYNKATGDFFQSIHQFLRDDKTLPSFIESFDLSQQTKASLNLFRLNFIPYLFIGLLPIGLSLFFIRTNQERNIAVKIISTVLSLVLLLTCLGLAGFEYIRFKDEKFHDVTGFLDTEPGLGKSHKFRTVLPQYVLKNYPNEKIYNTYNIGGYLIWDWYTDKKVLIDGRSIIYQENFFKDYTQNFARQSIAHHKITKALCSLLVDKAQINGFMRINWVPTKFDNCMVLFEKKNTPEEAFGILPEYLSSELEVGELEFLDREHLGLFLVQYMENMMSSGRVKDVITYYEQIKTMLSDIAKEGTDQEDKILMRFPMIAKRHFQTAQKMVGKFGQVNHRQIARLYKTLRKNPQGPAYHNTMGDTYFGMGNRKMALVEYNSSLKINPNNPKVHIAIGELYYSLKDFKKAMASFKKASLLNPKDAIPFNNLAATALKINEIDEALSAAQRAVAIKPSYAEAHLNLAVALEKKGRTDEALAEYQKTLQLKPNFREAQLMMSILKGKMAKAAGVKP